MKTVKIDNSKLERDVHSKAVLSTNINALEAYKMEKKRKESEMDDINNMKQDIKELKEMLRELMGKQNG